MLLKNLKSLSNTFLFNVVINEVFAWLVWYDSTLLLWWMPKKKEGQSSKMKLPNKEMLLCFSNSLYSFHSLTTYLSAITLAILIIASFFFVLDLYAPLQMPVFVHYKPNIFIFKAHKCYVYWVQGALSNKASPKPLC